MPPEFDQLAARIEEQLMPILADADWLICHNVCSLNKNLALTTAVRRISEAAEVAKIDALAPRSGLDDAQIPPGAARGPAVVIASPATGRRRLRWWYRCSDRPSWRICWVSRQIGFVSSLMDSTRQNSWRWAPKFEVLLRDFRLLEAAPLMLLPVRITRRKNIELALKILSSLRTRFPQARLVVTGPRGAAQSGKRRILAASCWPCDMISILTAQHCS